MWKPFKPTAAAPAPAQSGVFDFHELLAGEPPTLNLVDVGAMSLGPHTDAFDRLLGCGAVRIVGFEPVQAECDKLNALHGSQRLYLPYAIGDGRRRTFHECNLPMTSSLYEPNNDLLDKFQSIGRFSHVIATSEIETRRLDDIPEVADADYLKLDVQGAELDVINGAANVLRQAVLVHTEAELVPMYRDQPLFGDVDCALRRNGFLLHQILAIASRTFKPLVNDNNADAPGSQALWCEAVYIRDFMTLDDLPPEKLLKLALMLHVIYRSTDTCAFVLQAYQRKTGDRLFERYLQRLTGRS